MTIYKRKMRRQFESDPLHVTISHMSSRFEIVFFSGWIKIAYYVPQSLYIHLQTLNPPRRLFSKPWK